MMLGLILVKLDREQMNAEASLCLFSLIVQTGQRKIDIISDCTDTSKKN